jgi:hypothetical protein
LLGLRGYRAGSNPVVVFFSFLGGKTRSWPSNLKHSGGGKTRSRPCHLTDQQPAIQSETFRLADVSSAAAAIVRKSENQKKSENYLKKWENFQEIWENICWGCKDIARVRIPLLYFFHFWVGKRAADRPIWNILVVGKRAADRAIWPTSSRPSNLKHSGWPRVYSVVVFL